MAETYLRATRSMTVQLNDGRTVFVAGDEVVREDDLSEFLVEKLGGDDPHYSSLFESASASDYEEQDVVGHHDPIVEAEAAIDALARERANFDVAVRQGGGANPVDIPPMLDAGRTLPESGADTPAADRYARGENEGRDKSAQLEDLGVEPGKTAEDQDAVAADGELKSETVQLGEEEEKKAPAPKAPAPKASSESK